MTALYKISQLFAFPRKCLSGQQGLNLLGRPGHQVLGVFVAVSWAGQRRVDLPVGPAHQLCGLAEDVLPAQTHETFQTAIQMDFFFFNSKPTSSGLCRTTEVRVRPLFLILDKELK